MLMTFNITNLVWSVSKALTDLRSVYQYIENVFIMVRNWSGHKWWQTLQIDALRGLSLPAQPPGRRVATHFKWSAHT